MSSQIRTAIVLVLIGMIITGGITLGSGSVAADTVQDGEDRYAVVQGEDCVEVSPITPDSQYASEGDNVTEFYGYSIDEWSSTGTTPLQQDDTSVLLLYESDDELSLVMVHDQYEGDTRGGSATFEFENLPEDGEWILLDDEYEGNDDRYFLTDTTAQLNWVWQGERTDGGIYSGLGDEFAVEIEPRFNNDSRMRFGDDRRNGSWDEPDLDDSYNGTIEDWGVVSMTDDGAEGTVLSSIEEPVTVRDGSCENSELEASVNATPSPATADDEVEFEVTTALPSSVETYDWTFGDDTTVTTEDPVVQHQYDEPGEYETTVTVEVSTGETDTASTPVVVQSDGSVLAEYANGDGVVELSGLKDGLDDWRNDQLNLGQLRTLIESWRTGEPVT